MAVDIKKGRRMVKKEDKQPVASEQLFYLPEYDKAVQASLTVAIELVKKEDK